MKWEIISLDFFRTLPRVKSGFESILMVVDSLTKVAHIIMMKSITTVVDLAKVFVQEIFRLHNMPKILVSDKDVKFSSNF